ncbi:hypothetical protein [Saccharopolyspora sp. NPDC002376]
MNEAAEGTDDLIHDLVAIIYSFSARLYGQRRSRRAQELSRLAREPMDVEEMDDDGTESS